MSSQPKLRIFAGPNGSGKTTLYNSIKSIYFSTQIFINADQLEAEETCFWDNSGSEHKCLGNIQNTFILHKFNA